MPTPPRTPCLGPTIDRRQWLTVGSLSLGALVTGIEPSLATLFAAEGRRALDKDFSAMGGWISSTLVRLGDLKFTYRPADQPDED